LTVTLRNLLALAGVGLLVALSAVRGPMPALAQEVVQDEGSFYRAFHEATQAGDAAKALAAAKEYLAKFPTGQYTEVVKTALTSLEYDLAIKERRTGDAITLGRGLIAKDADGLRIPYQLAFVIRANELTATPPNFDHVADAVEFSKKAIGLIQSGKTLEGAESFDKTAALALLTQVLAIAEAKNGNEEAAVKLYEESTAMALQTPQVAARNLLGVLNIRQGDYAEAVNALKAFPDSEKAAPEPKAEVKAALEQVEKTADAYIESGATFVAYAKAKNIATRMRDQINERLTQVYQSRYPNDAQLAGLTKMLEAKEAQFKSPPSD
jgi:tetratricopeptide (TPR) repeat protein